MPSLCVPLDPTFIRFSVLRLAHPRLPPSRSFYHYLVPSPSHSTPTRVLCLLPYFSHVFQSRSTRSLPFLCCIRDSCPSNLPTTHRARSPLSTNTIWHPPPVRTRRNIRRQCPTALPRHRERRMYHHPHLSVNATSTHPRPFRSQVYVVDKTENNPLQVKGHPAWASEITLSQPNNTIRAMNVVSNSFCAGGNYLGDGRLLNVGGNQGITTGGNTPSGEGSPVANGALSFSRIRPFPTSLIQIRNCVFPWRLRRPLTNGCALSLDAGGAPYYDLDGGQAYVACLLSEARRAFLTPSLSGYFRIRLLTPCDDKSCNWVDDPKNYMSSRRWYPTVYVISKRAKHISTGA